MLKTIAVILVVFWLAGFLLHVAGSLIHLLLGDCCCGVLWSTCSAAARTAFDVPMQAHR